MCRDKGSLKYGYCGYSVLWVGMGTYGYEHGPKNTTRSNKTSLHLSSNQAAHHKPLHLSPSTAILDLLTSLCITHQIVSPSPSRFRSSRSRTIYHIPYTIYPILSIFSALHRGSPRDHDTLPGNYYLLLFTVLLSV